MNTANRIIINTVVSYFALLFKMAVGIFSIRFVLQALGETRYGVYVAVAGIIALLDMINGGMVSTSMRYLANSLGSGDKNKIHNTFTTSLFVHYVIGLGTVITMELLGLIFLEYVLKIPPEYMTDARIVFQMMVASTFITMIAIPYDAVMNAHEHIYILSLFDILGAFLSLIMAICLMYARGDLLLIYGGYQLAIIIILRLAKVQYSKRHFDECRKVKILHRDKTLVKELLSFTGWTFFGHLAAALSTHLRGIIINVFFGVRLNAAEGVSRRVNNYINMVATSMTKAINPQMNKSEGAGDRKRMVRVMIIASKYSSFLFALIAIPFMIEAPYVFKLWLKDVPQYSVIFCQISMASMLISKFTTQIGHGIYAAGKIKLYQVLESFIAFLPLLLTYIAFQSGCSPVATYWIGLGCNLFYFVERYWLGKKLVGLQLWEYTKKAVFTTLIPAIFAGGVCFFLSSIIAPSFIRLLLTFGLYCLLFTLIFFLFAVDRQEKDLWKGVVASFVNKIKR